LVLLCGSGETHMSRLCLAAHDIFSCFHDSGLIRQVSSPKTYLISSSSETSRLLSLSMRN
jgi:hypothetical protein